MRSRPAPMLGAALVAALVLPGRAAVAQQRIAVLPEPGTPVVATEVLVVAGPASEPDGQGGIAYLAARAVTAPILPTLDSLGAHLSVTAYKDAVGFSLTAAPDAWGDAVHTLLVALFRDPPRGNAVLAQRAAIADELAARAADPADVAERAADSLFFGPDHPWSRPAVGSAESVAQLSLADVNAYLRRDFTTARAVAAVVGPIDSTAARERLGEFIESAGPLPDGPGPAQPADSAVWRDYPTVTTWTEILYPFAPDADVEALRFLARLTADEVAPGPERPRVFDSRGELVVLPGQGELRLQVVTAPEEAATWAGRLRRLIGGVADGALSQDHFAVLLRRYRGERLGDLATPESRARLLARKLLLTGRAGGIELPDSEPMTPARLSAAARALGRATVLYLGPVPDDSSATNKEK